MGGDENNIVGSEPGSVDVPKGTTKDKNKKKNSYCPLSKTIKFTCTYVY